jgi:hypothetical protein
MEGGMPRWKYIANIFLTALANIVLVVTLLRYTPVFGLILENI